MPDRRFTRMTLLVTIVAAACLYTPVLAGLIRQWWIEPASSHGFLLVAVAAFVAQRRFASLRALPLQPRDAGLVVVVAGLAILAAGTVMGDVFILRMSLPIVIAGAILSIGGTRHLRLLLPPLCLVALAVPLPAVVVTHATMPLQLIASQVAAAVLHACHVDVVREGNLLMLSRVTLEVADACSGLRSLVSLVSVTAVCAAVFSISPRRVAMLMAAAVPVAIVGNGLRVAATGLLSEWIGAAATQGLLHDSTGYAVFIVMFAVVLALHIVSRPRRVPVVAGAC